jgi:singapore isolate B (sub-type 7) whole genome shotgun sequence assembly, scaffold_2
MEVIENFTPVRKSKPLLSSTPSLQASPSVSVTEPETKHVTIPTVHRVTRKRPHVTQKEREERKEDPVKRRKMEEETAYYLKLNTANLQKMKDHLEAVKLKLKELKEKKKQKEKMKKKF